MYVRALSIYIVCSIYTAYTGSVDIASEEDVTLSTAFYFNLACFI